MLEERGSMWVLACVERSLMCMNGGQYNAAVKLSDYRKLESLNVSRASGSITDCCLSSTSFPCGLNHLMSCSSEIRERNAYRRLPDSPSSGVQPAVSQLDDQLFFNRDQIQTFVWLDQWESQ